MHFRLRNNRIFEIVNVHQAQLIDEQIGAMEIAIKLALEKFKEQVQPNKYRNTASTSAPQRFKPQRFFFGLKINLRFNPTSTNFIR